MRHGHSVTFTVLLVTAAVSCSEELESIDGLESSGAVPQLAALTVDPPLVISQVYGGGGNAGAPYQHDFVELFNRSSSSQSLSGLSLQYASATGTGNFGNSASALVTLPAGATIEPGKYYLVQLGGNMTVGMPLPTPDLPNQTIAVSGTAGKMALVTGTTSLGCNGGSAPCNATQEARIVDLIGFGGANYFEGAPTGVLSNTTAAIRRGAGCFDTNNNLTDFEVQAPAPRNSATAAVSCGGGGDRAPSVSSTVPADDATNVAANAAIQVTFSEAVNVVAPWFTFNCNMTGAVQPTVSGGPTTFTLKSLLPLAAGEVCTVVVKANAVTDADSADPPDAMAADFTFNFSVASSSAPLAVHTIQGAAHLSPYQGQSVNVGPAIVTALRGNGFYMQDEAPDADDATSEGIFVFTSSAPNVALGTRVTVLGTVTEFRPGCSSCAASDSAFDNLTTTEITSPTISVIDSGNALPAPVVLGQGAGKRAAPLQVISDDSSSSVETSGAFDPQNDGIDFYESLEAMRVQIDSPQVIDPTRTFAGSSLEIGVLARTDASLRTARGGILATENDFNPERVFLSNAITASFPNVNVGDAFSGAVIGVFDYTFANYKLLVTQALPSVTSGGLVRETTALAASAPTQLSVASMNVENLDALDAASKFSELAQIVVNNLRSPDLIALEEVQDNNGATNNGVVDATTTLNTFVSAIASAGGPSYVYRQIDPVNNADGGEPGGNIRVAFLFRTDRGLAFVDRAGGTSTNSNSIDTSGPTPHLAFSPGRIDPGNAAFNASRKPLAGEFTFLGRTLFVIANHFNSKGGDDPLFGRFQPPVRASEVQRLQQANILASFVESIFSADNDAFVIALGDFNDFSFSAPLETLLDVGLVDMIHTLPANERYTYVYQGNSQDLDHILVSPSLAALATYDVVHVNAEFATQASDHEPAVMRVELGDAPVFTSNNTPSSVITGGAFSYQVTATGSPAPSFSLTSAPSGMTIDPVTGVVSWTANVAAGDYTFSVQASNSAGSVSKQLTVRVTAPVPALPLSAAGLLLASLFGCSFRRRW